MIHQLNPETKAASAGGGSPPNKRKCRRGETRKLHALAIRSLSRDCRILQLARDLVPHLMDIATEAKIARDEALEALDNTTEEGTSHETNN
jgi:hypothetical protein